jgi:hypothetical protein
MNDEPAIAPASDKPIPAEPIVATPNGNPNRDSNFGTWLIFLGRKAFVITAIGSAISVILSILRVIPPLPLGWKDSLPIVLPTFQAFVITVLLFFIPAPRQNAKKFPETTAAIIQFYHVWTYLWVSWLALYLVLAAFQISPVSDTSIIHPWQSLITNFFNNISTIFFVMAYVILSERTVLSGGDTKPLPWGKFVAGLIVITGAEFGIAQFEVRMHGSAAQTTMIFEWISGVAAAVSIALFVGRLESKTIDPPRALVVALYFYAAIQVAWASFPNAARLTLVVLNLALVLKSLLFLFVAWLLQSGVLMFYMTRQRKILDTGKEERRAFLAELA